MIKVRTKYRAQTPYIRHSYETIGDSLYQDHLNRKRRSELTEQLQQIKQKAMTSQYKANTADTELTKMRDRNLEGIIQRTLLSKGKDQS